MKTVPKTILKFLLLTLLYSTTGIHAQETGKLQGKLLDADTYVPLVGAHIILTSSGDSLKYYSTTTQTGRFSIKNLPYGNYELSLSHIGYKKFEQAVEIYNSTQDLLTITIQPEAISLSEVDVVGVLPIAVQKGDTTQYQADAFKTKPDATAQELVEKMPGIVVDDGEVQAQGEKVEKVLVDNKPFFGDDPNVALRNLPAEIIAKIQVFDQQSEQSQMTGFDDGNTTKTMNIVTREGMNNGQFGKLYSGYGIDNEYRLGGNINFFNGDRRISIIAQSNNINIQNFAIEDLLGVTGSSGRRRGGPGGGMMGGMRSGGGMGRGSSVNDFLVSQQGGLTTTHALGINYQDSWGKKWDVTGSYFFNYSDNDNEWISNQYYFTDDGDDQTYYENEVTESVNINHRINLRMEYKPTENDMIRILPRLTVQQNEGSSSLLAESIYGPDMRTTLDNIFSSDLATVNASNQILYRHRFDKTQRTLVAAVTTGYSYNDGTSYQDDNSSYTELDTITWTLDQQQSILDGNSWNISGNLSYTEPLSKTSSLILSYNNRHDFDISDKETYSLEESTTSYSLLDTAYSNTFDSYYRNNDFGLGYRYSRRKLMFVFRGSYELSDLINAQEFPTSVKTENSFHAFLPTTVLRYKLDSTSNLFLVYRTNTNTPSLSQLQDVIDNSNPLQLSTGNPDLEQQYTHNMFLRYSTSNMNRGSIFFGLLSASYADNYIGNRTITATTDSTIYHNIVLDNGSQLIVPENINGYYKINSFLTYGIPAAWIKSNLNFNLSANFTRTPGYVNSDLNYSTSQSYGAHAVISSNISENLDFTIAAKSNLQKIQNTLNTVQNSDYVSSNVDFRLDWILWKGLTLSSNIAYQTYAGYTLEDNDYILWNMGIGKKLFANQRGEIQLSVYDLLNQNQNVTQSVTGSYIEETESLALTQYILLSFNYNLRNFNSKVG